jgi:hypothetical protein
MVTKTLHPRPASATALINSLDPYRPSSLCLKLPGLLVPVTTPLGTPIVMPDVYPSASTRTTASCTTRLARLSRDAAGATIASAISRTSATAWNEFAMRLEVLGWDRNTTLWDVPQGFGDAEYVVRRSYADLDNSYSFARSDSGRARRHILNSWSR